MALANYISLVELKAFLAETTADRDAELTAAIAAATAAIERECLRDFGPGQRAEAGQVSGMFFTPMAGPVVSVEAFSVDGKAVTPKILLGGKVVGRADGLPIDGQVAIQYTTAALVPADVKFATQLTAQAMADAAAYDQNATNIQAGGVYSASIQPGGAGSIPVGARSLLAGHVRRFIA